MLFRSTSVLGWQHLFNNNISMKNSMIYTHYDNNISITQDDFLVKLFSGITDWNARTDFNYFPNVRHNIKFGAGYIFHTFVPTNIAAKSGEFEILELEKVRKLYSHDVSVYVNDEYTVSDRFGITGRLLYPLSQHCGLFFRFD